jgi:hypothetical protein
VTTKGRAAVAAAVVQEATAAVLEHFWQPWQPASFSSTNGYKTSKTQSEEEEEEKEEVCGLYPSSRRTPVTVHEFFPNSETIRALHDASIV